jgi:hypothetical protein
MQQHKKAQEELSKKCESITNKKRALAKGNHLLLTILLQFQWLKSLFVLAFFMLCIMIIKNECKCTMLNLCFSSSFSLPSVHYCNGLQSQESCERSRVKKHFRNINACLVPRYFSHAKNEQKEEEKKIYSSFKMKSVKELSCGIEKARKKLKTFHDSSKHLLKPNLILR